MIRIITPPGGGDMIAFQTSRAETCTLTAHDLGHGHLELVATADRHWEELDWSQRKIEKLLQNRKDWPDHTPDDLEEAALRASAARAKSKVRRLCKVMGADAMLTLTYRENVTDIAVCKRHLKEFVRRVSRVITGFRAVCAFEQQARGAWHVHMAIERVSSSLVVSGVRLKSFNVLRAVWRSVTKENGGNVDLSQGQYKKRSPARIAAYLSKYLMKAFEDGAKWSNRWTRYGDIECPKPLKLGQFPSMLAAVHAAYQLVDGCASVVNQYLGHFKDVFFLVVEGQASDFGEIKV
ncbi:MAG: hypothetical protein RL211_2274 [Pseudomonadota bacterium]|jgi:hypothetical protein